MKNVLGKNEIAAPGDPLRRSLRADLAGTFAPIGVHLRVETNRPEILGAARTAFGRYSLAASGPNPSRFTIRLLVDPSFAETPPWPEPVFRGSGDLFYVSAGRQNTAVADLSRRHAVGFIAPAMAQDTRFLQRTFLECLLFTMATQGSGATHSYVHASAVTRGNMGLIFSGPCEAGKSTLAYACARRNFRILTDDVVYLDWREKRPVAWGRPWRMHFLPDAHHFFPELSHPGGEDEEIEIEVEELLPGRTQTSCEPAALFFLNRSAGRAECSVFPPEKAAERMARDMIFDSPEIMERHHQAWFQLALRGSYILRCGEDLDSIIRLLERFV
jgi:hypothetical protein